MIAIGFWLLASLAMIVSGVMLAFTASGYRVVLLGCVMIGLTPLGFIAGPGVPVYLPEILLVILAAGVFVNCYGQLAKVRVSGFLLFFCAFFGLEVVFAIVRSDATLIDLIRSARPIAFIVLLLLLVEILRQVSVSRHVTERSVAGIVLVCVLADMFFYAVAQVGLLQIGGISGEFFARTGIVRYMDLMTISLFGLANYFMFASEKSSRALFWLLVCGVIAALSLNRIFAIGFLIALSWWLSMAVRNRTGIRALGYVSGIAPAVVLIVAGVLYARSQPEAGELVSRVTELFDVSLLTGALHYRFVEPALTGGYELTLFSFFFGDGMGLRFYVPWFEYRGLDPWHFSVDSLFAFAFFKYGVVGVALFCWSIFRLIWNRPWDLSNAWIWLYLLVHSGVNVPSFLLFMIILVVLRDGSWLVVRGRADHAVPTAAAL